MKSDKTITSEKTITIDDVEQILVLKTWYASVFVLPIAKRVICFFSRNRILTPNQITFFALFFRILTAGLFLCGSHKYLISGAVFYYIAYMLDCVDGSVARLTNQTSDFGRYFDHIADLAGDIMILSALAYSLNMFFTPLVTGMIFMHIAESYISYISGFVIKLNKSTINPKILILFNKYRKWWFEKNLKSFLSFPDYTAFVFIVMPILGMPKNGLRIGFYLLSAIVSYTVLSTFVSLHTHEKRFP